MMKQIQQRSPDQEQLPFTAFYSTINEINGLHKEIWELETQVKKLRLQNAAFLREHDQIVKDMEGQNLKLEKKIKSLEKRVVNEEPEPLFQNNLVDTGAKSFFGGKGSSFRNLINLIPPHDVFISSFLGNCAVLRHIRSTGRSIGIDADQEIIMMWKRSQLPFRNDCEFHNCCGIQFLRDYRFQGSEFVYADPPYLQSTRKSKKDQYKHELTDEQHAELLAVLKSLNCYVMVSGYRSDLYERELRDWNRISFTAQTRGGKAIENVWINYEKPMKLHDYRYLGKNYREREKISRKITRHVKGLERMPELERNALLAAIRETWLQEESKTVASDKLPEEHVSRKIMPRERENT